MSKILISFLGTGPQVGGMADREYKDALYKLGDNIERTEYVAKALTTFLHPDKIFLVGTAHSMWEKIYEDYAPDSNNKIQIWDEIDKWCRASNRMTTLKEEMPHKKEIEAALGAGSKIFLIRYGLDDEQIRENINVILGIREYLQDGDEIVVDITHSFRSLPMLIMQLILYLKQIQSPKVNVSHVYYGMFEGKDEHGYTPIVDLRSIINLSDWIASAYAFKLTGNASMICEQIKNRDKSVYNTLTNFSSLLGLNALELLQKQVNNLRGMKYRPQPENESFKAIEALAIQPTVDEFIALFPQQQKASKSQFLLAIWQYKRMNYLAAFTTLKESIVTKGCEHDNLEWDNEISREEATWNLRAWLTERKYPGLYKLFKEVRNIRNSLVHQAEKDPQKQIPATMGTRQPKPDELKKTREKSRRNNPDAAMMIAKLKEALIAFGPMMTGENIKL